MIRKKIPITVSFYVAPDFFAKDVALLALREKVRDYENARHMGEEKSTSRYTEEEFIKEIEEGNVVVAMLREDPIGYAVIKNNEVVESYIEWGYRDSKLEEELKISGLKIIREDRES